MTELIINNDGTKGKVTGVVFGYVKLQEGDYKYQSTTEKQYSVDCIVTKEVAKAFKKAFPKNGYKEIETSDFERVYKIKPPFNGEEQFVIKVKANAQISNDIPSACLVTGDKIPYEWSTRPKVFVPTEGGVKDITMTTLIANGSKGDVAFRIMENSYGRFPQLTGILVKELIEYVKEGEDTDFGNIVGGFNPGNGDIQQVATVKEDIGSENTQGELLSNPCPEDINDDEIPF